MDITISVSLDSEASDFIEKMTAIKNAVNGVAPTPEPAKAAKADTKPAKADTKPAKAAKVTKTAEPAGEGEGVDGLSGDELADAVSAKATELTAPGKPDAPRLRKALNQFLKDYGVRKLPDLKFTPGDDDWSQADADASFREVYDYLTKRDK